MKRFFNVKALVLSFVLAMICALPASAQRNDNFIGWEENNALRDPDPITIWTGVNGITNNPFNDTPLGSGLLILVAAGAGYTVARRKRSFRKGTTLMLAFVMLLGMTQCKKKVDTISQEIVTNGTKITLDIDNGSKYEVNPPYVTFGSGDKIVVVYNGGYVGTLTHNGTQFTGDITIAQDGSKKLYFYFLSNTSTAIWPVGTTQYNASINYQVASPKVLSFGSSDQYFDSEVHTYTATLNNMCALVQFNLKKGTSNNVRISDMIYAAMIDFSSNTLTPDDDIMDITLYSKSSTEKLAILFPSNSPQNTTITIDGKSYAVTLPALNANDWVKIDVDNPAVFSVSSTEKVIFSPGNLQYNGGNGSWRFADSQYSYETTWNTSSWVDLMGYGTWWPVPYSGALPTQTSTSGGDYGWDGDFTGYTLDGHDDWFTLEQSELAYLCNTRSTGVTVNSTTDARYTMATVNTDGTSVNGLILFPDNYTVGTPSGVTWGTINSPSAWGTQCTILGWKALDAAGCVFLPAAGMRYSTMVNFVNELGYYWSKDATYCLSFGKDDMTYEYPTYYTTITNNITKANGCSVRLVRPYTAK